MQSLQLGFQTILSAPGFLYLKEGEGELDDFTLASRLSYFLWSSMPDKELFELAEQGKLKVPETLSDQVARMLADPNYVPKLKSVTRPGANGAGQRQRKEAEKRSAQGSSGSERLNPHEHGTIEWMRREIQLLQLTSMLDDCVTADGRTAVKKEVSRLKALGARLLRVSQAR